MAQQNPINSVQWMTIRPSGKTADYVSGDKLEFDIPREVSFIDGRQSYIYVEVENNSTQPTAGATANYPACWYAHVGASGMFQRVQLQDLNGRMLEDVEQANAYLGVMNSYGKDQGEYDVMAKVEGVSGHDPSPFNSNSGDRNVNIMYPSGTYDENTKELTGGNKAVPTSYCLPVPLGLWSRLGNDHQVFPNLAFNGTKMNIYFEKPNVCMKDMSSKFVKDDGNQFFEANYVHATDEVACDDLAAPDDRDKVYIKTTVCDTAVPAFGEAFDLQNCVYRVGQNCDITWTGGNLTTRITAVKDDQGTGSNQVEITFADNLPAGALTDVTFKLEAPTLSYKINKIELRVLVVMPNDPRPILSAVAKGINYNTTTLSKISTAALLKNSVLNVVSSMTRASSIWVLPCNADKLERLNESSIVYPQQDENNTTSYQWQIKDFLIPNKEVLIDRERNNESDNSIYRQQLSMALRPVVPLKAYGCGDNPDADDLSSPYVVGIQLAPLGNTFNLLENEPQLRYNNGSSVNTPSRLYHVYVNHTRTVKSGEFGTEVMV